MHITIFKKGGRAQSHENEILSIMIFLNNNHIFNIFQVKTKTKSPYMEALGNLRPSFHEKEMKSRNKNSLTKQEVGFINKKTHLQRGKPRRA